ncbi:MAG: replicative DNA helicase, partial [Clostridium sp.]|uniref:replicative DNA helicase n=1 Tax=Clostridium sp. TaxID=1506 RepID=UPI003EE6569A
FPMCLDELNELDFYDKKHKILFSHMKDLYGNGRRISDVNLIEKLRDGDILEVGGLSYVLQILNGGRNLDLTGYIKIVKEYSEKRHLREVLLRAASHISSRPIKEIREYVYMGLEKNSKRHESILDTKEFLYKGLVDIEERYLQGGKSYGMSTGFSSYDENIGALKKGELVVVAGRPGMGKTVFAVNLFVNLAQNGYQTLFTEIEMNAEALAMKVFSSKANIDGKNLMNGDLEPEDFINLTKVCDKLVKKGGMMVDCSEMQDLISIKAKAKAVKESKGLDVLIIDYLTLMEIDDRKENRVNAVGKITRGLKLLAKELDISIVLLSQLSRGVEGRADKEPMLSDLRDSGSIEQDADVVMFVYREDYYDKEKDDEKVMKLLVRKNRTGKVGTINLRYIPEYQRVDNL